MFHLQSINKWDPPGFHPRVMIMNLPPHSPTFPPHPVADYLPQSLHHDCFPRSPLSLSLTRKSWEGAAFLLQVFPRPLLAAPSPPCLFISSLYHLSITPLCRSSLSFPDHHSPIMHSSSVCINICQPYMLPAGSLLYMLTDITTTSAEGK